MKTNNLARYHHPLYLGANECWPDVQICWFWVKNPVLVDLYQSPHTLQQLWLIKSLEDRDKYGTLVIRLSLTPILSSLLNHFHFSDSQADKLSWQSWTYGSCWASAWRDAVACRHHGTASSPQTPGEEEYKQTTWQHSVWQQIAKLNWKSSPLFLTQIFSV